jgi:hypothetical protein
VTDTPPQAGGSVGCPLGNKSCRVEDFMNVQDIDQFHQHDYLPEVVDAVTNFMGKKQ